jgi:hypothetical protein
MSNRRFHSVVLPMTLLAGLAYGQISRSQDANIGTASPETNFGSATTVGLGKHLTATGLVVSTASTSTSGDQPEAPGFIIPQWSLVNATSVELSGETGVYDPSTNTLIVFGGYNWMDAPNGGLPALTNTVILQTGANGLAAGGFTTLIANGALGSPAARTVSRAVYDSVNNRLIISGGFTDRRTAVNDVWVLTNANGQGGTPAWTQLAPSGPPPPPRGGHTAVYDAANNTMTIFGGFDEVLEFNDVWVLSHANGLGGTPTWAKLLPAGTPPKYTIDGTAVYDSNNAIITVFGGANFDQTASTNEVWTLTHANGLGGSPQWTTIVAPGATGSPSPRWGHNATYDIANNRMTIFGGVPTFGPFRYIELNDVWVLANANGLGGTPAWTRLKPKGPPPAPRISAVGAYDAVNNRMIIFSGYSVDGGFWSSWVLTHANGL